MTLKGRPMLEVMNWSYNAEATEADNDVRPKTNPKFVKMVHAFSNRAKSPHLDREAEISAILEWQTTQDPEIMAQLLEAYNDFISSITSKICNQHGRQDLMSDAWSHACELFIAACKRFDASQGARISTFAKYSIVGGIHAYMIDQKAPIRTATSYFVKRVIYNYHDLRRRFKVETGREMTTLPEDIKILSEMTGYPESAIKRGMQARAVSMIPAHMLHLPVQEADSPSIEQEEMMRDILSRELAALRETLSSRDFDIVRKSFLSEMSGNKNLQAIATEHQLTVERIGQIYRAARTAIRDSLRRQGIRSFAEAI
jgi:RNA polymerase sigma factor (sigma-70 family)